MVATLELISREFHRGLYTEFLEEASFLYEQRLGLYKDPEITWLDIADWEERLEAHIDALVIGEEPALEICERQANEGDFGELHAAMRVFCRRDYRAPVSKFLDDHDFEDEERTLAVTDALKYELPRAWRSDFQALLQGAYPELAGLLATVLGYRRIDAGAELLQVLRKTPGKYLPPVIWALGRLNVPAAGEPLRAYLQHKDPAVQKAAALALLRQGDRQALDRCLQSAGDANGFMPALGLCGHQASARMLLAGAAAGEVDDDCLIALGLLGDIAAIETLIDYLGEPARAAPAALALWLLTGADLAQEIFVPEEIDEDELFEEELKQYKEKGKAPARPDGEPFGETITVLARDPGQWREWLGANRSRFRPELRYRAGKPYSPAVLLETLLAESTPHQARYFAYEELVVRYGMDFPFETDMPVSWQQRSLNKIAREITRPDRQFEHGVWYFSGRKIASSADQVRVQSAAPVPLQPDAVVKAKNAARQNEAGLWAARDKTVHDGSCTLENLVRLDAQLAAHLEDLYAGGDAAWERCREALALSAQEPARAGAVFAVSVIALRSKKPDRLQLVMETGFSSETAFREFSSALGWLAYGQIDSWVGQLLTSRYAANRRIAITACRVHRRDPGAVLATALEDTDSALLAAALRAAGELKRGDLLPLVEIQLASEDPVCRFWAAWSATLLKSRAGVEVLLKIAETDSPFQARASDLVLRAMDVSAAAGWVRKLAARESTAGAVLRSVAVIGLPTALPWLLKQMQAPQTAVAAGRAFSVISGVSAAQLGPDQYYDEARRWWADIKNRLQPETRYLLGEPITVDNCRKILAAGPQRSAAALELALRQTAEPLFETRAPGARQRQLLQEV